MGPTEAYRFARGETVTANNGMKAKFNSPLDFLVVADHAEYIGLLPMMRSQSPVIMKLPIAKRWAEGLKVGGKEADGGLQEKVYNVA